MEQREKLVTGLVGSLLGTANNDLISSLLAAGFTGVTGSLARLVVLGRLGRSWEEDQDLVASLQAVDLGALGTNQLPVELGLNLKGVGRLILELAT